MGIHISPLLFPFHFIISQCFFIHFSDRSLTHFTFKQKSFTIVKEIHIQNEGYHIMQCDAKCFYVKINLAGIEKTKTVFVRTPITAIKTIRKTYGETAVIKSVQQK